jgi:hypothetical protein
VPEDLTTKNQKQSSVGMRNQYAIMFGEGFRDAHKNEKGRVPSRWVVLRIVRVNTGRKTKITTHISKLHANANVSISGKIARCSASGQRM